MQRRTTQANLDAEKQSTELQAAARRIFLGSPEGERILNHILDVYCAVDAPMGPMASEAAQYRNGARDVGVRIKELVYADLTNKIKMQGNL